MQKQNHSAAQQRPSRRDFLKTTAVLGSAALAGSLAIARGAHAAGSDVIKVGLIGCGGRGSGAAANAMNAGKDVRLVAVADLFEERVKDAVPRLKKMYPEQATVDDAALLRRLRRLREGDPERRRRGGDRLHVAFPSRASEGRRRRRQARVLSRSRSRSTCPA